MRAAELTPAALKTAGAKRGFAEFRLLTEWRAVVGEALAAICRPVKVAYGGRGGIGLGATLVVAAEGARAPEVEMQSAMIMDRVNAFYGYRAVSRLAIDQSRAPLVEEARRGLAEDAAPFERAPGGVTPAKGVADEGLALALGRLEANIKAKAAKSANAGAPKPHDARSVR